MTNFSYVDSTLTFTYSSITALPTAAASTLTNVTISNPSPVAIHGIQNTFRISFVEYYCYLVKLVLMTLQGYVIILLLHLHLILGAVLIVVRRTIVYTT